MRNGAGCWPTMQHLCRLAKYGIDRKDNHNSLSRQWSIKILQQIGEGNELPSNADLNRSATTEMSVGGSVFSALAELFSPLLIDTHWMDPLFFIYFKINKKIGKLN